MKKLLSLLVAAMLVFSFGVCKAAEGENGIITPKPIDPIFTMREDITKSTIALTEGWNLIAMPVLPLAPYTVEQFIRDVRGFDGDVIIPEKIYWSISVVAVYKNGRFECYPKESITYNMVPGEAYFVHAEYHGERPCILPGPDGNYPPEWHATTSITVLGKVIDKPVSLHLNRGWSGVSVSPFNPVKSDGTIDEIKIGPMFSMPQLSAELVEQGIKAKRAVFWNAEKQEWEQYALPYAIKSTPGMESLYLRMIRPNEGFFLLCDENGLYIPMLNTEVTPEPPVPPFPPKPPIEENRVSYTGRIEGVGYLMFGPPPPYTYSITTNTNERILLKGIDEEIEDQLLEAAKDEGNIRYVEGVMTTMMNGNGRPYGVPGNPVDVLLVDTVQMVGQLH